MGALTALSVGMQVFSAISAIQGGNAQAAAIKAAGRDQQAIANYQANLATREGVVRQNEAKYRADQNKVLAGQNRASAQRAAIEQKRKGRAAQSKATAMAAAGGGTVADVYGTIAGIGAESEYAKMVSLFEGEDAARGLESQAALDIYSGEEAVRTAKANAAGLRMGGQMAMNTANTEASTAKRAGYQSAISSVASAGGSLMGKYSPSGSGGITWNAPRVAVKFGPYSNVGGGWG